MIPPSVVAALRAPAVTGDDFTPTTFCPGENKAWFVTHFLRFASSDFPKHQFTERFYNQLMYTFGHIAHYDHTGFWTEFFVSTAGKVEFLERTTAWPTYGRPDQTWCDAEREIIRRVRAVDLAGLYRTRLHNEEHAAERKELARLKAKYEVRCQTDPASPIPDVQRAYIPAPTPAERTQLAFTLG